MQAILALLSDSKFHSGEELGEVLGVTRAAVWKKLKKLESIGVKVHSVKGKGYRLPHTLELLSKERLYEFGVPENVITSLSFNTESTNSDAKDYITRNGRLPALFATEWQTKGRGRRGRQWESAVAKNVMMSFAWRFDGGPNLVEGLSLAVGVGVAQTLRRLGVQKPELKWPNDVQINGKKVCGILLEMVADQDVCHVIIGIGLNIQMNEEDMTKVEQPWTDLSSRLDYIPSRNQVIANITNELVDICSVFAKGNGIKHYQSQWQQHDVLYDQPVVVISASQQREGIAKGINESGALLLEENGELAVIHGGEVSVRRR